MILNKSSEKEIRTICGFCHTNCGLIAHVKDDKIVSIKADPEHPVNRGNACPKGLAARQIVYSPDRLKYPLRRTRSGFKRITWDEALDIISTELLEIRDKHGGETIIRSSGAPVTEENRDGFSQLVSRLGSNNYTGAGHICHLPRSIGFSTVCGHMPQPDYPNTQLILIWGANPLASGRYGEAGPGFASAYGRFSKLIPDAKKRRVKLIVIDPCRNRLAEQADKWLQLIPGTDDAFALAMLNVIIKEKLYDMDFVEDWTMGFRDLADHIERFTPIWAEKITGIKASDIQEIARLYATTKPALIREGNAIDQYTNAVQTTRAIAILEAITGNIDRKGGNVFLPFPRLTPITPVSKIKRLSADRYPLFPSVPFPVFTEAIFTGKPYTPRAIIINHSNTFLIDADSNRTKKAFDKLDFIVVCDIFKTATTELADIILPEASPFERFGFRGYASYDGGFVALRRKVIEPVGETRSMFEVEYDLAKRMDLDDNFPFTNNEQWISHRLKASNISFNDLDKRHIIYATPPMRYEKFLNEGFNTPSGKIELYSQQLKEAGYPPLPEPKNLDKEAMPATVTIEEYPLIGTTRRSGAYTHTQFRNIPNLRKQDPECLLRINPDDASIRGISNGDMTRVESVVGKISIKAKLTDEIRKGVILIDFGWGNPGDGGVNVNILTSDKDRDPISCSTSNHRFRCQVSKL